MSTLIICKSYKKNTEKINEVIQSLPKQQVIEFLPRPTKNHQGILGGDRVCSKDEQLLKIVQSDETPVIVVCNDGLRSKRYALILSVMLLQIPHVTLIIGSTHRQLFAQLIPSKRPGPKFEHVIME